MWRDIGLGDWLFDFDQEEDLKSLNPKFQKWRINLGYSKEKLVLQESG